MDITCLFGIERVTQNLRWWREDAELLVIIILAFFVDGNGCCVHNHLSSGDPGNVQEDIGIDPWEHHGGQGGVGSNLNYFSYVLYSARDRGNHVFRRYVKQHFTSPRELVRLPEGTM